MDEVLWNQLQAAMERDCLKDRAWLSSWFVDTVSKQPDLLEQLWAGSRDSDAIGWRWCEYRVNDRKTYPGRFLVFYDGYLHLLPTAPLFVLRCRCETCWEMGFYVSVNFDREAREAKGYPMGRCAACRRRAGLDGARRRREERRSRR